MSIAKRLYLLMLASLISIVVIAFVGTTQIQRVFDVASLTNINTVPSLEDINRASVAAAATRARMWQYLALDDNEKRKQLLVRLQEADKQALSALADYEKNDIYDAKDKELLQAAQNTYMEFSKLRSKALQLADEGKRDEARDLILNNQAIPENMGKAFSDHNNYNIDLATKFRDSAKSTLSSSIWFNILFSLIGLTIIGVMGFLLVKRIVGSLDYAVAVANVVAEGDLSQTIVVSSNDEVGRLMQSLKAMNDALLSLVANVRSSTDNINSAATEIASGNMDLSSRTESQASALEETASSLEELTSTVRQNADNARQANQLANSASSVARQGGDVVNEVVTTMSAINDSSRKIVDIIGVIDGIAFQTNILALNAAVEAARAGEQGRGFAVVAAEVRNLAQRSASAAKEIKSLIDDSVDKVERGSNLVNQAGQTIQEVVKSVQHVSDVVSEISAASQEQTAGIDQINLAVTQMDETTQQNAALVEQAAAAAAALQDQASSLSAIVDQFKIQQSAQRSSPSVTHKPAPAQAKPVKVSQTPKKTTVAKPALKSPALANKPVSKPKDNDDGDWTEF